MSLFSNWTYPSDIDLFYSPFVSDDENGLMLAEDEYHHIANVMKYKTGDTLYVTDGKGNIYFTKIEKMEKKRGFVTITEKYSESAAFRNIVMCLPLLKNSDRLELAYEKLIELGFTRFNFVKTEHSLKKNINLERMLKIGIHAMTQSLHGTLPDLGFSGSIQELLKAEAEFIIFDQKADNSLKAYQFDANRTYYFIFGPEGGFSETEVSNTANKVVALTMGGQRLRAETAMMYAGFALSAR
ncbi:MAG: 16S rRNA (uracil(1498)-N(3))-methyltransferase [Ignavibacteria bacterium]|nr:16S rRNA (uracil(1498)-N(3))-methyltransferase [Ignavibacteria bacterium]